MVDNFIGKEELDDHIQNLPINEQMSVWKGFLKVLYKD